MVFPESIDALEALGEGDGEQSLRAYEHHDRHRLVRDALVEVRDSPAGLLGAACRLVQDPADQTIPSGTATKIRLDRADYDNDNMADLANNRAVVQTAGIYLISAAVRWNPGAGNREQINLRINGSHVHRPASAASSGTADFAAHVPFLLSAGDVVEAFVSQHSAGDVEFASSGASRPHLSLSWIGRG